MVLRRKESQPPLVAEVFTTSDYNEVKRLYAAGIEAQAGSGSPMVFEYALDDRERIRAVLGR